MSCPFHRLLTAVLAAALALSIPAARAMTEDDTTLAAIPETWAAAFGAVRADPPPEQLTRNSHYLVSDEKRHDLFRDDIADKGGVFIGLGPDQNYLMAGWARPEVLVLLDFDQMVVDLHAVYRAAFLAAGTAGEFLELWSKGGAERMEHLLADEYGDGPRFADIRGAYRKAQRFVAVRLDRVQRTCAKRNVATYLDDPEQYGFVRALFRTGRVFPVRGDLTATMSVRDVAGAARASGLSVRVLYLSNAEQYFPYGDDFRANMLALPFDEHSVVIRTAGLGKKWAADGVYEYVAQSGENFHVWMTSPKTRKVWRMIGARQIDRRSGHSWIRALPPEADTPETTAPEEPAGEAAAEPPPVAACGESPTGMACVPGGPFLRGTDTGPKDARPMETVWVQTFHIDLHHVTNEEYRQCTAAGDCREAGPRYRDFHHPRQPVTGVNWYDAVRYCQARGKRLPTEAQWEKAARGTDGRSYPWGDEPATCERAVIKDHRGRSCGVPQESRVPWKGRPFDVGSRPAGVHGLFDMAGNSWDWVRDWYAPYRDCGDDCRGIEPLGPCAGKEPCGRMRRRVVRGGSWYWDASRATTWYRRAHVPSNDPFHHFGFRCAATVDEARAIVEAAGREG